MLAICAKEQARDTTFIKNKLRNEQGRTLSRQKQRSTSPNCARRPRSFANGRLSAPATLAGALGRSVQVALLGTVVGALWRRMLHWGAEMPDTRVLPLAVTMGEPAGIGPDIAMRLYASRQHLNLPPFILYGHLDFLKSRAERLGLRITLAPSDPGARRRSSPTPCRWPMSTAWCPTSRATRRRSRARW